MKPRVIVAWRDGTTHYPWFSTEGFYGLEEKTICRLELLSGDWYTAPEDTNVLCMTCLAEGPPIHRNYGR